MRRAYCCACLFFFNDTAPTEIYTLSLHDALPIWRGAGAVMWIRPGPAARGSANASSRSGGTNTSGSGSSLYGPERSEEHTSELQSRLHLVCRLLLEKKKSVGDDNLVRLVYLTGLA